MHNSLPILLLPVENQVREFDPKLLLACVAAWRGYSSVIGPRRDLEFRITSFQRSIFISKDLRSGNGKFFRILNKLGHVCVAWDEEALIHLRPEFYYRTRLNPRSLKYVCHLFAWGRNNAELWEQFPNMPSGTPIHTTGNPRGDMLRQDMRHYFQTSVDRLRKTYGKFILVNTNFSAINAFTPIQNVFAPVKTAGEEPKFGRAARGLSPDYAIRAANHVQAIFEDFKKLIPLLDQAYPDLTIVVRPHPSENPKVYYDIASQCERVQVTNEGNVVPWLMAARALIHNGCTTGLEAFAVGLPSIAYRSTVDEYYDNSTPYVPNMLSNQCFSFKELQVTLGRILSAEFEMVNKDEQKALFERYLTAQEGPLASERIADILEEVAKDRNAWPKPSMGNRVEGWYRAIRRRWKKQLKSHLPGAAIPQDLQRHRYPELSLEEVSKRVSRLQQLLKYNSDLKVDRISDQLFQISA